MHEPDISNNAIIQERKFSTDIFLDFSTSIIQNNLEDD